MSENVANGDVKHVHDMCASALGQISFSARPNVSRHPAGAPVDWLSVSPFGGRGRLRRGRSRVGEGEKPAARVGSYPRQ